MMIEESSVLLCVMNSTLQDKHVQYLDNGEDPVNFARKPCWAAALMSSIATPKWKSASPYRCISSQLMG